MPDSSRSLLEKINLPPHIRFILEAAASVKVVNSRQELLPLVMGAPDAKVNEIYYEVDGKEVHEATLTRCKNGVVVNYPEIYMRRRDPDCMVIGDSKPTDKPTYNQRFGQDFAPVRDSAFTWLQAQELMVSVFPLGALDSSKGYNGILIAPANSSFFVAALADLQGIIDLRSVDKPVSLHTAIYLAPPFRHTHFSGKQVVVHNRLDNLYEIFSFNLYPGPSAKKGVYGSLLSIGEHENWLTLHAATVQVKTPYDNITTIMHEGASGSGKSEMLEYVHREGDGRLLLGKNLTTGEKRYLTLPRGCELNPVTDDMAMCFPNDQKGKGQVVACDAEHSWFVRLNHIKQYGTDPHLEYLTTHPAEPLIFISVQGSPDSTALIWEHTMDKPGIPCPNPRVVLPRRLVPGVVSGKVNVQLRNFGLRTPPCTAEKPTYGIAGYLHFLSPSLGWLWRLVAPRGHDNPSITDSNALVSEGVGSYWPFSSGRFVDQANLLLRQIVETPMTRYSLTPNQHVGAWKVSFMPQWVSREYLARRGIAPLQPDQIVKSRSPLLGYTLKTMAVEGTILPPYFLRVDEQPEIGVEGFNKGAKILQDFFKSELEQYLKHPDLDPLGRKIIECCMSEGTTEDYDKLIDYGV